MNIETRFNLATSDIGSLNACLTQINKQAAEADDAMKEELANATADLDLVDKLSRFCCS